MLTSIFQSLLRCMTQLIKRCKWERLKPLDYVLAIIEHTYDRPGASDELVMNFNYNW